jgi:hypothetical protein
LLSLSQIHKEIHGIFAEAKPYEGEVIQNGVFINFESVAFESTMVGNYNFKLLVAGNTLDKNSKGVLPKCDELIKTAENNHANCIDGALGSQLNIAQIQRVNVREGLFCYEIALTLRVRFA